MPWAKFDDRYPWHRKVRPLSDAAFRLDASAICWCAENLTNGVIEGDQLGLVSDVKRPSKAAGELLRTGRWHRGDHDCEGCPQGPADGFVIHDYLDYNPTREKVEEDREKRRKAGELGGKASGRSRSREAKAKQSASQVLNDLPSKTEAPVASSATNPRTRTPSPSVGYVEEGGYVPNASGPKPPLYSDRCSQHGDVLQPGNCGDCADVRKANRRLAVVGPHNPATKPHCGQCDETRHRETPFGVIRCPECHPRAEEAS
jgi:hypothetical protein